MFSSYHINRYDDSYSFDRQQRLQDFLRSLVKNQVILERSKALRKFFGIDPTIPLKSPNYESTRDKNIIIYDPFVGDNNTNDPNSNYSEDQAYLPSIQSSSILQSMVSSSFSDDSQSEDDTDDVEDSDDYKEITKDTLKHRDTFAIKNLGSKEDLLTI